LLIGKCNASVVSPSTEEFHALSIDAVNHALLTHQWRLS